MIDFILKSLFLYLTSFNFIHFDEAYYWCYSNKFELSYCSKPPLISWILLLLKKFIKISLNTIRLLSFFINFTSYILLYHLFNPNIADLFFNSPAGLFSRFIYTTDIYVILFQILNIYNFNNNNYILLALTNTMMIYSKQIGFLNFLLFFSFSIKYLYFLIINLILILPLIINDIINKNALLNHTIKSNLLNNVKINYLQPFIFIIEQIILIGPISFINLINNYFNLNNLKFIYLLLFFVSFFKRININWTIIIYITILLTSNVKIFYLEYNLYQYLFVFITLFLFKFLDLTIKKKFYDYYELSIDIKNLLKINKIKKITFLNCRKLGSYLWFYTRIKPIKIILNENPLDQFDIWKEKLKSNEKYLLINYNKIKEIKDFKIIKEYKYIYKYNTFYLYVIIFN